jgi:thioesterase domain-containing protein
MRIESETMWSGMPLSSPQKAIWIDQVLHPGKPIYNTGQVLHIHGSVEPKAFVAALERAIEECDALRLRFDATDEDVVQRVAPHGDHGLTILDFSESDNPEGQAREWVERMFWKPMNPRVSPLFEFALIKLGEHHTLWVQKYHHLVIDATGRQRFAVRVAHFYNVGDDRVRELSADSRSFRRALEFEAEYLASPQYGQDARFWAQQFARLPEFVMPSGAATSERDRSGRPGRVSIALSPQEAASLRSFSRASGSTPFKTLLLITWSYMAINHSLGDLVIGVALGGRRPEVKDTVGVYSKVIPLRVPLDLKMSVAEGLAQIETVLAAALQHRWYPMAELHEALQLRRMGRTQLYDVVLNYVRNDYDFKIGGNPVSCENLSSGFFVPWAIMALEYSVGGPIEVVVDYDPGQISVGEARHFLESLMAVMERLGNPNLAIADLALKQPAPTLGETPDKPLQREPRIGTLSDAPSDLEFKVLSIWRDCFNQDDIEPTDNFFDIGGTSLKAIALVGRCNGTFGTDIPVVALFEAPTVRLLAQLIHAAFVDAPSSGLVVLRKGSSDPAVVLIHPIGGTLFCYRALVERIGGERPIFGIAGSRSASRRPDAGSFEELAESYAREIRNSLAGSRWHLAGFSLGGALAFAIARALEKTEDRPLSLTLLDAPVRWLTSDPVHSEKMRSVVLSELGLNSSGSRRQSTTATRDDVAADGLANILDFAAHLQRLRASYEPRPIMADATLIRASADSSLPEGNFDWQPYIRGNLWCHTVAADHNALLLAPSVERVADVMTRAMAAAETRAAQ